MKRPTILAIITGFVLIFFGASCASTSSLTAVKPYPLNTCLVSGSELGSMGDPVTKVYNGQEVKFCCTACIAKIEKEYLASIQG